LGPRFSYEECRRESHVPRYHFLTHASDHKHDDPDGLHLPSHDAARDHGYRVVRELKEGGYHPPGATLLVQDEAGEIIHPVPF
jgi:hypothetical protein